MARRYARSAQAWAGRATGLWRQRPMAYYGRIERPASRGEYDMTKLFLLVAGVFLFPVALSYGVDPAVTIPKFMNFTVEGTDQTHIFRALMGLYLGMVTFCIIAAFTPEWRHVAVIWAVFFAYSLAAGRILSLIVDGMPSPILLFYLVVELTVGTVGLLLLNYERREGRVP